MSAALIFFPTLEQTDASLDELRAVCDFREIGYHYIKGHPGSLRVFRPKNKHFWDDQWNPCSRAETQINNGGNVVRFRPSHLLLRVIYDSGDHSIWLFLPTGQRVRLIKSIHVREWAPSLLGETRACIFRETGVWARTVPSDWDPR